MTECCNETALKYYFIIKTTLTAYDTVLMKLAEHLYTLTVYSEGKQGHTRSWRPRTGKLASTGHGLLNYTQLPSEALNSAQLF